MQVIIPGERAIVEVYFDEWLVKAVSAVFYFSLSAGCIWLARYILHHESNPPGAPDAYNYWAVAVCAVGVALLVKAFWDAIKACELKPRKRRRSRSPF